MQQEHSGKSTGKGQCQYKGRWVDIEHFRAPVYKSDGSKRLAKSYAEFLKLTQSGLWFASRHDIAKKDDVVKQGGSKDALRADSKGVRGGRLSTNKREQPNSTAARERPPEGNPVHERAAEVVQLKQPFVDHSEESGINAANRATVHDIRRS